MSKYSFKIEVVPTYLPNESNPQEGLYVFSYQVTIGNFGEVAAQVIPRHWAITDGNNKVEEVRGLGVVGQQPLIRPGKGFQYTSGTRLATPHGTMGGSFFCVAEDGERFEVPIETFILAAQRRDLH